MAKETLFEKVDCVSFYVENLEDGISFYSEAMGLHLLWRTQDACGLGLSHGATELVLETKRTPLVQFKVESVEDALAYFLEKGGVVEEEPFDVDVGKCAIVRDCWGNRYCIADISKGNYEMDEDGNVIVVKE